MNTHGLGSIHSYPLLSLILGQEQPGNLGDRNQQEVSWTIGRHRSAPPGIPWESQRLRDWELFRESVTVLQLERC